MARYALRQPNAHETPLTPEWEARVQSPGCSFADLQRARRDWLANARAAGFYYAEHYLLLFYAATATADPVFKPGIRFVFDAGLWGPGWVRRLEPIERKAESIVQRPHGSRRFATLRRISAATGNMDLQAALAGLVAYGLDGDDWRKRLRRLATERENAEALLAERIAMQLGDTRSTPTNIRQVCRDLVVSMGIEATSFEGALKRAELAYREYCKARRAGVSRFELPPREQSLCDGFMGWILVRPNPGRRVVDPETRKIVAGLWHVPDVRFWRQRLARGDVKVMWRAGPDQLGG